MNHVKNISRKGAIKMGAYEEILKLKELHDSKVISDSEFEKLKGKIISDSYGDAENTNDVVQSSNSAPVIKTYSKTKCASCDSQINFSNRLKLKDGAYVCKKCLKKAGFSTLVISASDASYILHTLTLDTLFSDHSSRSLGGLTCPKCGSGNIQFMQQNKKAFSIGKATAGGLLTGGVGTLAGFAGKKGKKEWFCQNCNNIFNTKK